MNGATVTDRTNDMPKLARLLLQLATADNIMIPMRGTARYGAANVSCDVESRVSSDSRTPTDATTGSYADVADSGMHSDRVEVAKSDLANNVSQEAASGNVNGLELAALACISSQASLESNWPDCGRSTRNCSAKRTNRRY